MTDQELRKLSRKDLLKLLIAQGRERDAWREESEKVQTTSPTQAPTVAQLERELEREICRRRYHSVLRSTIYTLITVAAAAVLVATVFLPVLRIYGTSMEPAMTDGDLVVSVKSGAFRRGDILAFWLNNKILVKRVIAQAGEWVDIDEDGNVSVNGEPLDEPYLTEKSLGTCDIELPYQVPDGRVFVMGDHRSVSMDSRTRAVGCVAEEQIVGKLVLRVWPLNKFGRSWEAGPA